MKNGGVSRPDYRDLGRHVRSLARIIHFSFFHSFIHSIFMVPAELEEEKEHGEEGGSV